MKPKLKRAILLALSKCDGQPMPESALVSAAQIMTRPLSPTISDVTEALKDCEAEGYCLGVTEEVTQERSWTLTAKGTHATRRL